MLKALAPARENRFQSAEEMRKALSEIITQISPRADAERAAEFLRSLYDQQMKDERVERDQLLTSAAPLFVPSNGRDGASPKPCRCRWPRWSNPARSCSSRRKTTSRWG